MTLINSFGASGSYFIDPRGFSALITMSSINRKSFNSTLAIFMPSISFYCLIAKAKASSAMKNASSKEAHTCLVADLRRKTSKI